MATPTAEQIAQRAFDVGLLDELQLQKLWADFGSQNVSSGEFMQLLVRREIMTNYQLKRLVKGDRTGFFYGDYKVLYFMGSGTFSRVYRAAHRETGQVVAIKVLRKRYSADKSSFGQFVREGELGCTLRHPNIVPIYEVHSRDTTHFLVMEFVEGRNMREFVQVRKKIEPAEATRLMIDITAGLRYAYEQGLTHRDLKMTNVLVSSRGRAKLVDFGLAAADPQSGTKVKGELANARTVDYAALEKSTGVRKDDNRSDIYFLGCIFYNMLTGQPPLPETKDRARRMSKTKFIQIVPIIEMEPELPNAVSLVVNTAMELDPDRRYQTPGLMLTELISLKEKLAGDQDAPVDEFETEEERRERQRQAVLASKQDQLRTVMVVESDPAMQDVFRNGLKKIGYRVLVISDPRTALERFRQEYSTADCVLFNAQNVGRPALDTFNRFGQDKIMERVPALLLLEDNQHRWSDKAETGEHRVVLPMPITMKILRETLSKLIEPQAGQNTG